MLLMATALVLALSQAALAAGFGLAPTPTAKQHVAAAAAVFARQTGGGRRVLDECSSVLDNFLDLPTPPPDLSSYAAQVAATQTGAAAAAAIRFPDSLSSRASKYQSSVLSWCSEQRDALTKCTELPALQSQYSGVCQAAGGNAAATGGSNGGTGLGINIFNNFDTGAGSSAGGGGGGGGGSGSNGGSNGGDGSSGGGGMSSGAIAGIVIGVLAAVGVLAGIAAFVIWRARRKRAAANPMDAARQQPMMSGQQTPPSGMLHSLGQASTYDKDSPTYSEDSYHTLPHERSVHEMPGVRAPAELMGSTEAVPVELHNPEPVYEMLADYRPNKAAVANVGYKS